jgi:hypothetical protein
MPAPRLLVVRTLGNDLPPVHTPGQTRANALIALSHERPPAGVHITWQLNRIVNQSEEQAIVSALHGNPRARANVSVRALHDEDFACLPESEKLLHVTNQNAARNHALREALRLGARWVLPLDSNQFLTERACAPHGSHTYAR